MTLGKVPGMWLLEIHLERPNIILRSTLGVKKMIYSPSKTNFPNVSGKNEEKIKKESQTSDMEISVKVKGYVASMWGLPDKLQQAQVKNSKKFKGAHEIYVWLKFNFDLI